MASDLELYAKPQSGYVSLNLSAEEWKQRALAVSADELSSYIKRGDVYTSFYQEFLLDRDKWGKNWSDGCVKFLGVTESTANRYIIIYLASEAGFFNSPNAIEWLPSTSAGLSNLSKAMMLDYDYVMTLQRKGEIKSEMDTTTTFQILKETTAFFEDKVRNLIRIGTPDKAILETNHISKTRLNQLSIEVERENQPKETAPEMQLEGPEVKMTVSAPTPTRPTPMPVQAPMPAPTPVAQAPKVTHQTVMKPVSEEAKRIMSAQGSKSNHRAITEVLDALKEAFSFDQVRRSFEMWIDDVEGFGADKEENAVSSDSEEAYELAEEDRDSEPKRLAN